MLMRMPRAPWIALSSSSGEAIARLAASTARFAPLAEAVPMTAYPMPRHDGLHVGEVAVDDAGNRDDVRNPLHALTQNVVGDTEGFEEAGSSRDGEQPLVGNHDGGVDRFHQFRDAALGLLHAAFAFERERLGHDRDGQRAHFAGQRRNDRARRRCRCLRRGRS